MTEYVTKPGLKTYSIFDTIHSGFDRNSELIGGDQKRCEKARSLLTKVVNAFYWKNYVKAVHSVWETEDDNVDKDRQSGNRQER